MFKELERRGPLSGLGFFTIERSTITGMLSTAVTYIIILVQFRMSTNWYETWWKLQKTIWKYDDKLLWTITAVIGIGVIIYICIVIAIGVGFKWINGLMDDDIGIPLSSSNAIMIVSMRCSSIVLVSDKYIFRCNSISSCDPCESRSLIGHSVGVSRGSLLPL